MRTRILMITALMLLLAAASTAWATQKCDGSDMANGPFTYTALGIAEVTFNGSGGSPVYTSFSITAPNATPDTSLPNVFPGEGQNPCVGKADASILALEIQKVGDSNGNPITPIKVDSTTDLGQKIVGAFSLSPINHTFTPGDYITVDVAVGNPDVSSSDYGDYEVKLAAQAPGSGIGVGDGPQFLLKLRVDSWTDITPPNVTVTKPVGDQILGVIPAEIQAVDPVGSHNEGTGVASMSATVSSAGHTVDGQAITLTFDQTLPVAAGVTVTGTGSFVPVGGSGDAGTTGALAFESTSRSGIGTYTINAQATDVAGNTGYASKTFEVLYDVAFEKQSSTKPCATSGATTCMAQFQFTVNRSSTTSDGKFMFDHTVVVKLKNISTSTYVGEHVYGTGDVKDCVQIDDTNLLYETHFKHGDIKTASGAETYVAEVYFLDVDGTPKLQKTSNQVTF